MSRRKIEPDPLQTLFLRKVEQHGHTIRTKPDTFEFAWLNDPVERTEAHYQVGGALFDAETGDAVLGFKFIEADRAKPGRFVVSKRGADFLAKLTG